MKDRPAWDRATLRFVTGPDVVVSQWTNVAHTDLVALVDLLNKAQARLGGPTNPIVLPNPNDPLLSFNPGLVIQPVLSAVRELQMRMFGRVIGDGEILPSSAFVLKLANMAAGGDGTTWAVDGSARARAIKAASAEHHAVGDFGPIVYTRERKNWMRLKEYFDFALTTPRAWSARPSPSMPLKFTCPDGIVRVTDPLLNGVKLMGMRVPQSQRPEITTDKDGGTKEYWRGTSWCGIFAVWAWRQAGLDAKWGYGPMLGGVNLPTSTDLDFLLPGDIVLMKGKENHHAMVAGISADGKEFLTVDGNSGDPTGGQTILHKRSERAEVAGFYSVDTVMSGGAIAYKAAIGGGQPKKK